MRNVPGQLFALLLVIGLLLTACGSSSAPAPGAPSAPANAEKWTLDILIPNSGYGASYAADYMAGLNIALKEMNAAGGILGKPVTLNQRDTQSDIAQAVSLAQTACSSGSLVIIGPLFSTEAQSVFPVINKAGCPIIAPTPATAGLTDANRPWTFVMATPATNLTPAGVKRFAKATAAKTAVVVLDKSDTAGTDQGKLSAKAFGDLGVQVLDTINTQKTDVDFSPVATRIAGLKPDVVVVSGNDAVVIGLIESLHKQGQGKTPVLVTQAGYTNAVLKMDPSLLEGTYFYTEFDAGNPDPRAQAFVKEFKALRNNATPTQLAAQAYDSLQLVKYAMEQAKVTGSSDKRSAERTAVRDALQNVKDWSGITGKTTITDKGYPNKGVYLLIYKDGKLQLVQDK